MHVAPDRQVWFGTDKHPAVNSKMSPKEFVTQDWIQNGQCIRLVGDWENAELISRLWNIKLAERLPLKIYLTKTSVYRPAADEQVALMRQVTDSPSCGGWHQMTAAEYPGYGLISVLQREGNTTHLSDVALQLLQAHPAYPALSFVPTINLHWAAALVSFIVDPRWHVDPTRPERLLLLRKHLGLGHPESCSWVWNAYLRRPVEPRAQFNRVQTVVESWAPSGSLTSQRTEESIDRPDYFLSRLARGQKDDLPKGLLKATRVFVRFVRDVWLDRLTPARKYLRATHAPKSSPTFGTRMMLLPAESYAPQLFVAKHFFKERPTLLAWGKHVDSLPRV